MWKFQGFSALLWGAYGMVTVVPEILLEIPSSDYKTYMFHPTIISIYHLVTYKCISLDQCWYD